MGGEGAAAEPALCSGGQRRKAGGRREPGSGSRVAREREPFAGHIWPGAWRRVTSARPRSAGAPRRCRAPPPPFPVLLRRPRRSRACRAASRRARWGGGEGFCRDRGWERRSPTGIPRGCGRAAAARPNPPAAPALLNAFLPPGPLADRAPGADRPRGTLACVPADRARPHGVGQEGQPPPGADGGSYRSPTGPRPHSLTETPQRHLPATGTAHARESRAGASGVVAAVWGGCACARGSARSGGGMSSVPGLQADCEELLGAFQEADTVRFERFAELWRERRFHTIF